MKFSGKIGFWLGDKEVRPSIWNPEIEERPYKGDIIKNTRRFQNGESQNDDLVVSNRISILSDLYLRKNWSSIKYVIWNDVRLKVTSIDISYPRVILDIGGVYHGPIRKETTKAG